jgi:hypothetical protein
LYPLESIEFCLSAFKHGIGEEDIRWAFLHPRYDGPLEEMDCKFIRLGFDRSGNLLEIMYNESDEHTVSVFHAMKCRSIYYHLLKI